MAAGDNPYMTAKTVLTWEKESTFGTSPASGAWNTFGYRRGELRDLGPINTWQQHRAWESGREPVKLDLLSQDFGAPLAEFLLTDLRIPGFAWGEEVSAPAQIGATVYYRHTATPSTNHPTDSMAVQIHDEDAAGNATRTTWVGGVMTEIEIAGAENGEVSFTPTIQARKPDTSIAKNTVTTPTSTSYKHHHGYIEIYGEQLLRVNSWRFRKISEATRLRYWNDTDPLYAYEYPLGEANYVFSCRAVADGKQFSGFGSRDILRMAENGDIGTAQIRWAKTVDQDEGKIVIGSSNDALGIITVPRVRSAGGGRVEYEIDFVCRTSQYQWVDTNASRYFSS